MLTFIGGSMGSGKSLLATYIAVREAEKGRAVYTNWKIRHKAIRLIDKDKLLEIRKENNAVLMLDEASTLIDSRHSNSLQNRVITHILKQSRKGGLDVYLIDNVFSAIDVRARRLVQVLIQANHPAKDTFIYTIIDLENFYQRQFMLKPEIAKKIYQLYDTHEAIGLTNLFMSKEKERRLKEKLAQ